ncbi:hypothetical protein Tco_1522819 [Tanacetum coccineum]
MANTRRVWNSDWIRRIQELDTSGIGEFLGVGTTLDIFQNIILIPYLKYGVLSPLDMAYYPYSSVVPLVKCSTIYRIFLAGYAYGPLN